MYVDGSAHKVMTYQRSQVEKITSCLPQSHHVLEDILSRPSVRKALLWMTKRDSEGKCFFMRLCENYDNPQVDRATRWRWAIPNWAIDLGLRWTGLNKETMKRQLFHHPPTVKALTLTAKSIGTHGLTVPQRYTAPLFTVWNITQACNLDCKHCYQDASRKPQADELTTEEKFNLIDQMAEEWVPFVAFAGGEPLVLPDLWKVLERCRERGIHVTIATNGTMLTPEMCVRLREAQVKYIEASIDSLDPEEHDEFRGQKGAWARTIQGIKNSVAAGIKTGMAVCFTRPNVDTVDDVVKFAIDLGCSTFAHFNFIPVGRGKEIVEYDMTPTQRELLLRRLQAHLTEGKITVVSTAPQFGRSCIVYGTEEGMFATGHAGRGQGKKTMVLSRYIGGCGTGRCYCAVQPNGAITPCVYIPRIEVGNIRRNSLKEIWNNNLFDVLSDREDRGDHCGVCHYRHYCGGCRARALSYTDDIQAGDPGCIFNQHEWEEVVRHAEHEAATVAAGAGAGGNGDNGKQAGQLVQILAVNSVAAAAQRENMAGMAEGDVREVKDAAQCLASLSSRNS
jgi:radical SAM protein with 4Fe4S-binding SPASM domain